MKKEKIFFPILVVLILVGIAGIPTVRYALYLAPVIAVLIMLVTGDFKFQFPPSVQPFILLLIFCIFTIYRADYNWARQTYFILAYTTIFVFYDFSNIKVNIKLFNLLFIAVFLVKAVLAGQFGVFALSQISLIDSKSALESTLAFPLGLFAIFFLYKKNYLWFLLNVVIVVLAFKRVVLFGVVACVLLFFIPRRIRAVLLSPYIITTAILLGVVFQLTLAVGEFDSFIKDAFGISTNHLLMGRQELWQRAIDFTDFNFWSFSYYGVGHGTLTNFLEGSYSMNRVLLHNDFLLILFENG
ncbi:MAG: hypothetical protein HKO68_18180, partial [Desulfobacterales bacterium]|nr:hypothetical protein [Desulfobacterales bacterium]